MRSAAQRVHRHVVVAKDALLPEGQRRHRARGAREPPQVARRQEQPQVAAASALVGFDELLFQVGQAAQPLFLEQLETAARVVHLVLGGLERPFGLLRFRDADVALDFELADVAEERLGLAGEPVRFLTQRAKPVVHAALRARGIGRRLLREQQRDPDQARDGDDAQT